MKPKYIILLALVLTTFAKTFAQQGQIDRLAIQYFEQNEFEKANVYFQQLYEDSPEAWFNYYFRSLLGAGDLARAEKITRRQLKQNKQNVFLYVYLGRVYRAQHDDKKEKEAYEKAVRELIPVQPHIDNLAIAFKDERLYEYALAVYNKGKKSNPEYPYFYERADIYKQMNDPEHMIGEYLDALEFRETELQTVQMQLQNSLGYDDEKGGIRNPLLRQELQKRIQKHPDKEVLAEFLIFILKQQRDFEGAFVQSRALDKRRGEDGQRIYELAKICKANSEWATATKCYEYLLQKGIHGPYNEAAVIEGLEVEYLSLTAQAHPDPQLLAQLEQRLEKALDKYQYTVLSVPLVRELSSLRAFYLGKSTAAINLLRDFIEAPGIDAILKAEFKILLADIYLLTGEIWEASLLYSQVEKEFKYEAIGNEAKFRNARLSYYAGDFAWAKTQADVLKGSTSKLIANDALDLSLVITDAIGVDTNALPLRMFSSAELLVLQHRYPEATQRMDSINLVFSNHTLGDDIYYKKALIYFEQGDYKLAEENFRNVVQYYPSDLYGDDAQFKLAELYEYKLHDNEKARKAYEELLINYPGSIYTVEARKRFRSLRGDQLNN